MACNESRELYAPDRLGPPLTCPCTNIDPVNLDLPLTRSKSNFNPDMMLRNSVAPSSLYSDIDKDDAKANELSDGTFSSVANRLAV